MKFRSTGNWAEDLGNDIDFVFKGFFVLLALTPILIGIIIFLLVRD